VISPRFSRFLSCDRSEY